MFMLLPILLLGGGLGGANELLDYAQTNAYWKAKSVTVNVEALVAMIDAAPKADDISALIKQLGDDNFEKREAATAAIAKKGPGVIPQLRESAKSTDAEIADRSTRLIAELSGGDTDPAIHKLMIIRTLGELKDKAALPALKPLAESKEPFVSAYARRAIAQIEGKPFVATGTAADTFEKDLWTLPKGVKLVTQLTMPGGGPLDWAKALEGLVIPGGAAGGPDKDTMLAEAQKGVRAALNAVGNVRIDGITLGVSGDPGPQTGFMIVLVRGQYSREKVVATFKKQGQNITDAEGVATVSVNREGMNMLMVSDELFAIVGGPPAGNLPVKETLAAIKAGKGTLADDADMVALIKSANRKTGGWAVAHMTDTYRSGATWMAPFDSVIAERVTEKGKTTLKIVGTGKDAGAIATAVTEMNTGLEQTRTMFKQAGGAIPKPMIDFFDSIKIESNAGKATITGNMEGSFESMLGSMLMPMMMLGGPGGL
jgi:hypothetical protein